MTPRFTVRLLALALPLLASTAQAHRSWLLPSATVLSGKSPWVTVDAAVSNELFSFEHVPVRLDGLQVTMPSGQPGKAENVATGKLRSVFDVALTETGTWRLMTASTGLMASWEENGERKRWRGSRDAFAKEVPAGASGLQVTETSSRVETFVTASQPTTTVLQPSGKGLELVQLGHPNDLVVGEAARFRLLMDGQPANGLEIEVVPGGKRYRDQSSEQVLRSDARGEFSVTWPVAGMYWLSASLQDDKALPPATQRRASYVVTLEVMAP